MFPLKIRQKSPKSSNRHYFCRLEDAVAAEVHEEGHNSYDNDAEDDVYPHEGAVVLNQFTVTHDGMVMDYGIEVMGYRLLKISQGLSYPDLPAVDDIEALCQTLS